MWVVVCELLPVSHFHKMTNETYAIWKNDKEVTSNFPISTPASTSSFCSFCSHYPMPLPPLSPQSFSPQPTPQPYPPLSDFSPTHFPPATGSVIPSCHPTLMNKWHRIESRNRFIPTWTLDLRQKYHRKKVGLGLSIQYIDSGSTGYSYGKKN